MKPKMLRKILASITIFTLVSACANGLPGGDARKRPPQVKDRIQKNIEEGRGFRLMGGNKKNIGDFDFASSNELWRASLDTLDFMPLALANYSGGIVVTDWYSDGNTTNESVKISVRFLSNEIRADALVVKVFYKNCSTEQTCKITDKSGVLSDELTKKILTRAALYEKQSQSKNKKKYINEGLKDD
tara:strand:+ start:587 stop:1147 length:561 start_codon:yes stop_codon:yes gene_type:complete